MRDPFGWISQRLMDLLVGWGMGQAAATALLQFLGAAILATALLLITLWLIWAERKILGRFQDRIGPNRAGPYGFFQTIADFIKLVTKEIIIPNGVDRPVYLLAPVLVVMAVIAMWAVIPLAPRLIGTDINVGVLYIVSVGSIGTLSIIMAGWSSNNKFALLGAFRAVAQLVSYEVPMVLVLLIPVMLAGTMGMGGIVAAQQSTWFIVLAPIAMLIFVISSMAENGRAPFDLMEGESEIVAGFNIEYSALAFGMFYVNDFLHAFTIGALVATLFLGGWQGPGAEQYPLLGGLYLLIKTGVVWFVTVWIRGSFPRVRIDQLLAFNWKFLTPLSLAAVIVAALADKLAAGYGWNRIGVHWIGNLLIVAVTLWGLQAYARTARRRLEARVAEHHPAAGAAPAAHGR